MGKTLEECYEILGLEYGAKEGIYSKIARFLAGLASVEDFAFLLSFASLSIKPTSNFIF